MATLRVCNSCKEPITQENPVMFKLFMSPVRVDEPKSGDHGQYTAHADIGRCCARKFVSNGLVTWTKRKPLKGKSRVGRHRAA